MRTPSSHRDDGESFDVLPRHPKTGCRCAQRILDISRPATSPRSGATGLLSKAIKSGRNLRCGGEQGEGGVIDGEMAGYDDRVRAHL